MILRKKLKVIVTPEFKSLGHMMMELTHIEKYEREIEYKIETFPIPIYLEGNESEEKSFPEWNLN